MANDYCHDNRMTAAVLLDVCSKNKNVLTYWLFQGKGIKNIGRYLLETANWGSTIYTAPMARGTKILEKNGWLSESNMHIQKLYTWY